MITSSAWEVKRVSVRYSATHAAIGVMCYSKITGDVFFLYDNGNHDALSDALEYDGYVADFIKNRVKEV